MEVVFVERGFIVGVVVGKLLWEINSIRKRSSLLGVHCWGGGGIFERDFIVGGIFLKG